MVPQIQLLLCSNRDLEQVFKRKISTETKPLSLYYSLVANDWNSGLWCVLLAFSIHSFPTSESYEDKFIFKKKHWWQHLPNSFAHLNVLIQISIFEVFQPNIGHDWPEIPPPGRLMLKIALCFAAWSSNSSLHCGSLVTQPRSSSHWAGFPQYSCSLLIISQYQSWSVHAKMNRKKKKKEYFQGHYLGPTPD